nr:ABC transporter B family member 15-like [Tanacetum cinerariifolium]
MHANGADTFLMALGVLGAIGDGIVMPTMLFVSNSIVNIIEDTSSSMFTNVLTYRINQPHHSRRHKWKGSLSDNSNAICWTYGLGISSFDVIVPEISIPSPNHQQSLLPSSLQAPPRGTNALVIP